MCEETEEIDVCDICGNQYLSFSEVDFGVCPTCAHAEDDF